MLRAIVTWIARFGSDQSYLSYLYKIRIGQTLNWKNPTRFTEKINVMKLRNKDDLAVRIYANKFDMRRELKKEGLGNYLVPLVAVYEDLDHFERDLFAGNIEQNTFIKLSNDCGSSTLFTGGNHVHVLSRITKYIKQQRHFVRRTCEYQYSSTSHILVEKNLNQGSLYDVKVFLAHGKVIQIMLSQDKKLLFCDPDLKPMDVRLRTSYRGDFHPVMDVISDSEREKILNFICFSKGKLEKFNFCRLDMITNERDEYIYINEITFTPSSGLKCYIPDSHDFYLGSFVDL